MQKRHHFFGLLTLCAISFMPMLEALPTRAKFLFEFGSEGTGNGEFCLLGNIAVNEYGEIIATDVGNDRVQVFDRCGNFLFSFGEAEGPGQLMAPFAVAVNEDNHIIVGDENLSKILVFDRFGDFIFSFDTPFGVPSSIAVNEWGEIIVAYRTDPFFEVFDRCGNFLFRKEILPDMMLRGALGAATDSDGNIYVGVLNQTNDLPLIKVFDRCGRPLYSLDLSGFDIDGSPAATVGSIAVSESGEIVIGLTATDRSKGRVLIADRCGNFLFDFDFPGGSRNPIVTVDKDGNFYGSNFSGDNFNTIFVFQGQSPIH